MSYVMLMQVFSEAGMGQWIEDLSIVLNQKGIKERYAKWYLIRKIFSVRWAAVILAV